MEKGEIRRRENREGLFFLLPPPSSPSSFTLHPKNMRTDWDYIVLGLGGFGSAAAYWLARRAGTAVLGLEQFELGHTRGESQDHSRIIRLSYHTPEYVELAKHAFQAWAEMVAGRFGYTVRFMPVGPEDPVVGAPTQMGVFSCE